MLRLRRLAAAGEMRPRGGASHGLQVSQAAFLRQFLASRPERRQRLADKLLLGSEGLVQVGRGADGAQLAAAARVVLFEDEWLEDEGEDEGGALLRAAVAQDEVRDQHTALPRATDVSPRSEIPIALLLRVAAARDAKNKTVASQDRTGASSAYAPVPPSPAESRASSVLSVSESSVYEGEGSSQGSMAPSNASDPPSLRFADDVREASAGAKTTVQVAKPPLPAGASPVEVAAGAGAGARAAAAAVAAGAAEAGAGAAPTTAAHAPGEVDTFDLAGIQFTGGETLCGNAIAQLHGTPVEMEVVRLKDVSAVVRYKEEAKTVLRSLSHPNIVRVRGFQVRRENVYVVAFDLHAASLRDLLAAGVVIPYAIALRLSFQLCSALSYLHKRRLSHWFVHPSTVMVDVYAEPAPNLALLDTGEARAICGPPPAARATFVLPDGLLRARKAHAGSADFFAPEVDVFGLAFVLWSLLSSVSEEKYLAGLDAATPTALLACKGEAEDPFAPVRPPLLAVPLEFRALIAACWSQEPAARPPLADVVNTIRNLILASKAAAGVGAGLPAVPPPQPAQVAKAHRAVRLEGRRAVRFIACLTALEEACSAAGAAGPGKSWPLAGAFETGEPAASQTPHDGVVVAYCGRRAVLVQTDEAAGAGAGAGAGAAAAQQPRVQLVLATEQPAVDARAATQEAADAIARRAPGLRIDCPGLLPTWMVLADCDSGSVVTLSAFVDGASLEQVIARGGCSSPAFLKRLAWFALQGLGWLHRFGLAHGALTPRQVLLGRDGQVYLTGLAAEGTVAAMRAYRAPDAGAAPGGSAPQDIWALGACLVACASGAPPRKQAEELEAQLAALEAAPELRSLSAFLRACLARDPAARPGCEDLLRAPFLQEYAEYQGDMHSWSFAEAEALASADAAARKQALEDRLLLHPPPELMQELQRRPHGYNGGEDEDEVAALEWAGVRRQVRVICASALGEKHAFEPSTLLALARRLMPLAPARVADRFARELHAPRRASNSDNDNDKLAQPRPQELRATLGAGAEAAPAREALAALLGGCGLALRAHEARGQTPAPVAPAALAPAPAPVPAPAPAYPDSEDELEEDLEQRAARLLVLGTACDGADELVRLGARLGSSKVGAEDILALLAPLSAAETDPLERREHLVARLTAAAVAYTVGGHRVSRGAKAEGSPGHPAFCAFASLGARRRARLAEDAAATALLGSPRAPSKFKYDVFIDAAHDGDGSGLSFAQVQVCWHACKPTTTLMAYARPPEVLLEQLSAADPTAHNVKAFRAHSLRVLALEAACVLRFYVIPDDARGLSLLVRAAFHGAAGRDVIVVFALAPADLAHAEAGTKAGAGPGGPRRTLSAACEQARAAFRRVAEELPNVVIFEELELDAAIDFGLDLIASKDDDVLDIELFGALGAHEVEQQAREQRHTSGDAEEDDRALQPSPAIALLDLLLDARAAADARALSALLGPAWRPGKALQEELDAAVNLAASAVAAISREREPGSKQGGGTSG